MAKDRGKPTARGHWEEHPLNRFRTPRYRPKQSARADECPWVMDSPLPPIWVEDEPTAAEIATETKSTQVVKIEATLEFLKDQYAVMKRANKGYRKGCREYSKPRIGERLHGLLKTASKADSRLNQWSAKHIVKMMDQHDIWSVAAKD